MIKNENISIKGNETVEELVKKVNEVDSIEDKTGVCVMIITYLEIKNSVRPGSYVHPIGLSKKYPPRDPRKDHGMGNFNFDIKLFLFLLKDSDKDCYLKLTDTYFELSEKEHLKEQLIMYGFIGGFIVLMIILLSSF